MRWLLLAFLLLLPCGCGQSNAPAPGTPATQPFAPSPEPVSSVSLVDAAGSRVLRLHHEGFNRYLLSDAADRPLARLKVAKGQVSVTDPAGALLFEVRSSPGEMRVQDARGRVLYEATDASDRRIQIVGSKGQAVATADRSPDGYTVSDAAGRPVAAVSVGQGRCSIRDASGRDAGEVRGMVDAEAALWFAVPKVDRRLQAAAALAVLHLRRNHPQG